jgi:hypothetical protein
MSDFQILLLVILFVFVGVVATIIAFVVRARFSRAKDIERSLKMVPMIVQLPPQEVDDATARDEREVIKENISRAEGIYALLAGIAKKQRWLYSQRHISFEIVAKGKQIFFYVVVPVSLVSAVQKALTAAYPDIHTALVEDHNIFAPQTVLTSVCGGEFEMTAQSYYPLNNYKTLDIDPLKGLIGALSRLGENEGAAMQVLFRPAHPKWSKKARQMAKGILNPNKKRASDPTHILGSVVSAPFKSPDWQAKEHSSDPSKQADSIDQKLAQSIEEKASQPAFETLIRVVASTGDAARSRLVVQDFVNGFAQLNLPGSNSLKFTESKRLDHLATDYIFRFFPANKRHVVLNTIELATLFHLPNEMGDTATPIERVGVKEVAAPSVLSDSGVIVGSNFFQGQEKVVRLSDADRSRHMYIIGQTGTGKSVLLQDLAVQDMVAGKGICVIDPHGELAEDILSKVPPHRAEDVIYFNPGDTAMPLGLNILEFDPNFPEQRDFVVNETIAMLYKIYDPDGKGIIGPRFESWYRNSALTVMSDPKGATFLEIPKPFMDDEFLKAKFKHVTDVTVQDFWINEMGQTSDRDKSEMLGYFASKWSAFASNEVMRNIIGQHTSSFDFSEVMDESKILIVNLSKGKVGELNSNLLGIMFVIKILAAALARSGRPKDQSPQFTLYVDEFQNFSTDSFATILSEARKYNLCLVVANQFIGQLTEQIKGAVFGNVGTLFSYRCGPEDAEYLEKQFEPSLAANDLLNLPNLQGVVKLMTKGLPSKPFTIKPIFPPLGEVNVEATLALKELSRQKYGRPKAQVDKEVSSALTMRSSAPAPAESQPAMAPLG